MLFNIFDWYIQFMGSTHWHRRDGFRTMTVLWCIEKPSRQPCQSFCSTS